MNEVAGPQRRDPGSERHPASSSRHIRGSTLFLLGRFVAIGVDFATHVVMVRYLLQADFGALAYALSVVSLASSLAVLGLDKAVGRFVPIYEERGDYPRVFGTLLLMTGTVAAIGLLLAFAFVLASDLLLETVMTDRTAVSLLTVLIFVAPLQALNALSNATLAIYAKPMAIFVRRYVITPLLLFAVVVGVVLAGGPVEAMAFGMLAAGIVAVGIDLSLLLDAMRRHGLLRHFHRPSVTLPAREIFGFSLPLLVSDLVFILRSNGVVVLIEFFRSTTEVALFRAASPLARQNQVVMQSFRLLYTPLASRLFARGDWGSLNDLYWTSAVWIAVFSYPILVVSFSLAEPVTVLLYGERYAASAPILAVLAVGYYGNAAFGFNGLTLRVYGRVRFLVGVDVFIAALTLVGSLLLVGRFGALGAALAVSTTLILQNAFYHVGLARQTDVTLFEWRYLRIYGAIVVTAVGLLVVQIAFVPPFYVGAFLAAAVSMAVVLVARTTLQVGAMFPELLRFPLGRWLFGKAGDG